MNGILCVDKPADFTSFDVVAKMRGIAKTKKIGHGGTLDPMATGVLPLFFGGATKACDLLPRQDKRYTATLLLGLRTDTLDITGKVLERRPVEAAREEVLRAAQSFVGKSRQLPPMYSAVQVDGVRLYELARKGVEVERSAREIEIYSLHMCGCDETAHRYTLDIHCSRGTYVRSLCHDIGERLGCGAVLAGLRRTLSCGFTLAQCVTLPQAQQLADEGLLEERLLPVETAFSSLPRLELDERQARLVQNGVRLEAQALGLPGDEAAPLAAWSPGGRFLGLVFTAGGLLRVRRLFAREVAV